MFVFTNGNGEFVFISSVLFTEEEDIEQNKETKWQLNYKQHSVII